MEPSVYAIVSLLRTVPSHKTSKVTPLEQFKAVAGSLAYTVVVTFKDGAIDGQGSMLTAIFMAPSRNGVKVLHPARETRTMY